LATPSSPISIGRTATKIATPGATKAKPGLGLVNIDNLGLNVLHFFLTCHVFSLPGGTFEVINSTFGVQGFEDSRVQGKNAHQPYQRH
jgi:hypothetical protein